MVTKPSASAGLIRFAGGGLPGFERNPRLTLDARASRLGNREPLPADPLAAGDIRRADLESARVKDFLPDSLLDRIEAPLGEANGLPNAAYVCGEFFGLEQRYLFRRSWVSAGRADEIRGRGDIKPDSRASPLSGSGPTSIPTSSSPGATKTPNTTPCAHKIHQAIISSRQEQVGLAGREPSRHERAGRPRRGWPGFAQMPPVWRAQAGNCAFAPAPTSNTSPEIRAACGPQRKRTQSPIRDGS